MFCRNTYYKIIFIFNFDAIYSDFGDIALRIVVNEVKKLLKLMGNWEILQPKSEIGKMSVFSAIISMYQLISAVYS